MLVIRFLRTGKRNQPSFSIVVTEKERGPKSGRFIEKLGFYNPLTKERKVNTGRVKYWLSVGAKPSDTVWNLLVTEKIVEGKKVPVHVKGKEGIKGTETTEATKAAEEEAKQEGTIKNREEEQKTEGQKDEDPKEGGEDKKEALSQNETDNPAA